MSRIIFALILLATHTKSSNWVVERNNTHIKLRCAADGNLANSTYYTLWRLSDVAADQIISNEITLKLNKDVTVACFNVIMVNVKDGIFQYDNSTYVVKKNSVFRKILNKLIPSRAVKESGSNVFYFLSLNFLVNRLF